MIITKIQKPKYEKTEKPCNFKIGSLVISEYLRQISRDFEKKRVANKEKTKPLTCYEVWMSGDSISLRLNKGDDHFIGVVEKHSTD